MAGGVCFSMGGVAQKPGYRKHEVVEGQLALLGWRVDAPVHPDTPATVCQVRGRSYRRGGRKVGHQGVDDVHNGRPFACRCQLLDQLLNLKRRELALLVELHTGGAHRQIQEAQVAESRRWQRWQRAAAVAAGGAAHLVSYVLGHRGW